MLTTAEAEAVFASSGSLVGEEIVLDRMLAIKGHGEVRDCVFTLTPEFADKVWLVVQEEERQRNWQDMGWEQFKAYMQRWEDAQ